MATSVADLDLPAVDPALWASREDLGAALRELRAQGHWVVKGVIGYLVIEYDAVVEVLRDRRLHQAARYLAELSGVTDPAFTERRRESVLTAEGEEHARLRRIVAPAFTPKAADKFRPLMRQVMSGLIDPVAPTGRCELVADVCEPYPIHIICELLGAPAEDWPLFSRWATDMLRVFNMTLQQDLPVIMKATEELDEYMRALIDERRKAPREDLLSDLIAAHDAGDRLSTEELLVMAEAVLVAGTDTTRNQLACAVALLAEHPDQWALLAERPELAPRAVEEAMRHLGSIRATGRIAMEEVEIRGITFPAGSFLSPQLAVANRDPDRFAEPDRFDITRQAGVAQLSFGSGIHHCMGAWLARAELQEALPLLARRMPDLQLDGEVAWKPPLTAIWGPDRLPLRFTPTAA